MMCLVDSWLKGDISILLDYVLDPKYHKSLNNSVIPTRV